MLFFTGKDRGQDHGPKDGFAGADTTIPGFTMGVTIK